MTQAFDAEALLESLNALSEPKYAKFAATSIPGSACRMLGVRMPALRSISRKIIKDDWRGFLEVSRFHEIYEMRLLHAMVLGGARCPIEQKIELTEAFLPAIDNWAVCDCLCSSFKPRKDDLDALFGYVCACAGRSDVFPKRFGLVMLMFYFHDAPWAAQTLDIYRGFSHPDYYARMGAAWGLATLFLTNREGVLEILRSNAWDDFTHNKAIQKITESYRVSPEDKALARTLRRGRKNR